ncbi:hypothetical protein PAPHI01_2316 [Pancytospora philotis]|nr:hypothetical protein PAPHI01_2316 [Pancytospora philotis]
MFQRRLLFLALMKEVYYSASSHAFKASGQTVLDNQSIYEQLQNVAESEYFSKIQMSSDDSGAKQSIVDLLQVSKSHARQTAINIADKWPALHAIASRDAYVSRLLSGLELSINAHAALFTSSSFGWYLPNVDILMHAYNKSRRCNLEELYAMYRQAVAALLYSHNEIPASVLKLSAKITEQNAAQLKTHEPGQLMLRIRAPLISSERNYIGRPYISPDVLPLFSEMIEVLNGLDCEKCAVLTTLEINGMMAAVKVLNDKPLNKLELIYLINAFRRVSVSVEECARVIDPRFVFFKLHPKYYIGTGLFFIGLIGSVWSILPYLRYFYYCYYSARQN